MSAAAEPDASVDRARPTRIVLLSASAGAGHVRAAQALLATVEAEFPGVEAIHIDILSRTPWVFRRIYSSGYVFATVRLPRVWGLLYRLTVDLDDRGPLGSLRAAAERPFLKRLFRELDELEPDIVLTTHFLPAEFQARRTERGRTSVPTWVVVTDFDAHSMWVQRTLAGYFAAADSIAAELARRGVPETTVRTTGIPVMPAFANPPDRATAAAEVGLDPTRQTVLLIAGAAGITSIATIASRLIDLDPTLQLITIAGRNARLRARLDALAAAHPTRLRSIGFTASMERFMACSDLAVTKSGGLITSECLAMGLPMLVVKPIPGQEEHNATMLVSAGAGIRAADADSVATMAIELLADSARLAAMREAAHRLGHPEAAHQILETVLGTI